ncbi:ATP-binding protein, partial [Salmonella enterica subsp. enterica serovar Infantis]|nr:ATP-binding protein [Salmonella enterica subsp. enterica serovar Infantis]
EFFVINLYKMILSDCKLIVIDEIDISLDASAQVRLVQAINSLCEKYNKKIIFTTHSLPIMKVVYQDVCSPIFMLDDKYGGLELRDVSYAFVMGELFGFLDYDKYILTEDMMLEKYIKRVLLSIETNKKIKIIYIGGASNTNDLMKRNRREEFICNGDSMITILDGDSKEKEKGDRVYYSP